MRIWITGGAGFLGRRLTSYLAGATSEIVSLSRRPSHLADKSIEIDLAKEYERLAELVKNDKPEVVVHAASRQPGPYSLSDFVKANVLTTQNLIDSLRAAPPRLLIFTSTQSVYSPSTQLPLTEDRPASASNRYAASKRWAEQLLEKFNGSQVIILRLPSLFGVGQGDSFIDGLGSLALRNETIELFARGELIRDVLHVSDVCRAIQDCINKTPAGQLTLMNLGCGRPVRTREHAEALVDALGSTSRIVTTDRPASQVDTFADISLARRLIGFEPTELRESMRNYANELRT